MVIKKCFLFLCSCNPYNSKKERSEMCVLRGTAKYNLLKPLVKGSPGFFLPSWQERLFFICLELLDRKR